MDEKLYPPHFTVVVHAKDKRFFESSRYMSYQLTSGANTISGKLAIPSIGKNVLMLVQIDNKEFYNLRRSVWAKFK